MSFLSPINLCLHVVGIEGEYLNTTDVADVTKAVIAKVENAMDDDEFMISPNEAQIMAITEMNGRRINLVKNDVENLKNDVKSLKNDVESLKNDNKEVKETLNEILNLLKNNTKK